MDNQFPEWLRGLSDEDLQFVRRFLLASGSLKDLAAQYGISYPTIRGRLDRLIEKIKLLDSGREKSAFHKEVKLMVLEGQLSIPAAKKLIRSFEKATAGKETI